MQIYRVLGQYPIHGIVFPMYSVVLEVDGTEIISLDFHHSRKQKLEVFIYDKSRTKWVKCRVKNQYTEFMWEFYKQKQKQHKANNKINYAKLMRHDRKHKSGGGGSRIYNGSITDYECTKNPLHDFRRVYN